MRHGRMHVDVSCTVRRNPISSRHVRELVVATLAAERVREALVSVAFVGADTMARLNRVFLSHDDATDVISFGLTRNGETLPVIGDIYICPRIAERNAKSLGVPLTEELARLVIHGTLHILGYDHPEGEGRIKSAMWIRQERILDSLH